MITRNVTPSPTRERILDAADRLLARFGYQKTTAEDLAREAGVGRRTIYVHFTSKEEIFLASIDRVVARVLDELRRLAVARETAEARLVQMLMARILLRFDSVHGYHQSLDDMFAVLRPAYLSRRERWFEHEAELLADVLRAGRDQGELDLDDPSDTAHSLILATNSLLPYALSAQELGSRAELAQRVEALARLVTKGLRRRAGGPF